MRAAEGECGRMEPSEIATLGMSEKICAPFNDDLAF